MHHHKGNTSVIIIAVIVLIILLLVAGIWYIRSQGPSTSPAPYAGGEATDCNTLYSSDFMRDGCWTSRAAIERNPDFCKFLSVPQSDRLNKTEARIVVEDTCIIGIVSENRDTSWCDLLQDTSRKEFCETLLPGLWPKD